MRTSTILLLLFSFLLSGCLATRNDLQIMKTELEAERTAEQKALEEELVTRLKKEIAVLAESIAALEHRVQQKQKVDKNRIDLSFSTIRDVQEALRQMNKRIDSVDVQASKGSALFSQRMEKISEKLREIDKKSEEVKEKVEKEIEDLKPVENVEFRDDGTVRLPDDSEKSYRQLVKLTRDRVDGPMLRKAWGKYRKKFGRHRFCDTVYWIGESYYNQKKYNNAISKFRKIEKKCSDSPKREAAMLRIAYSLYHIGKYDLSDKVLNMMKQLFPKPSFPKKGMKLRKLIRKAKSRTQ